MNTDNQVAEDVPPAGASPPAATGGRDRGRQRHHAVCRPARRAEGQA